LPQKQDIAAFGEVPEKQVSVKGSKIVLEAGYCCLWRNPGETGLGQRQQTSSRIKNLLPPALMRRIRPKPKAAYSSRNPRSVAFENFTRKKLTVKQNPFLCSK
jgi:hypothetical protein